MLPEVKIRSGKVVVSDLLGADKKIYHAGETINEDQVPRGQWDTLVRGEYIAEDTADGAAPESGKKNKK